MELLKIFIATIPLLFLGASCIPDVNLYKITFSIGEGNHTHHLFTKRGLFTHESSQPQIGNATKSDVHGSLGKTGDNAWCDDDHKKAIGDKCCGKFTTNQGLMMTSLVFAFLFVVFVGFDHRMAIGACAALSFIFAITSIAYTETQLARDPYCGSSALNTDHNKTEILPGAYLALFPGTALMGIFTVMAFFYKDQEDQGKTTASKVGTLSF